MADESVGVPILLRMPRAEKKYGWIISSILEKGGQCTQRVSMIIYGEYIAFLFFTLNKHV